ncbi:MAG TPA: MBL fold metallo-hydrolase [Flavipsychrobacter sp.]|nr:MBL fold metallo-hydrolase [Flavipsychrobacter sp.]
MIKIIPLSEGVFTIGHDKIFHPFDPETEELNDRPTGSLLVEVQPFLLVTQQDVILLDTGLGFHIGNDLQLHYNLAKQGYRPEDVTKVLLSHLHKDHAGGMSFKDAAGNSKPSFPEAMYYIYKAEAEGAIQDTSLSYIPEELNPVLQSDQVVWLEGENGIIDENIRFTHSGGHSKNHIVFLYDDGETRIFFGGDEAPQLKQMKIKYVAKYDYDGKKAMQLREQYAEAGKKGDWQFLFYHDVKTPVSRL